MKNVLVIFGGRSVEHDISVITAMQVLSNLPSGYNFIPVYIDKDNKWWQADNLNKPEVYIDFFHNAKNRRACTLICGENRFYEVKHGKFKKSTFIDCALLCCHGGEGEGGALQGLLQQCGIPFTCPDYRSSVLCMDKVLSKLVLNQNSIKTVEFVSILYDKFMENKDYFLSKIEKEIGYPAIVKPSRLGSSVGIHICSNRSQLLQAVDFAKEYDTKILIEKYIISSKEYACACMQINGKIYLSSVQEISKGKLYSFEEKYLHSKKSNKRVSIELQEKIKKICKDVYVSLECSGLVRVDFLMDSSAIYVCEVNTIPGSLAFNLFDSSFRDLIANLIEECCQKATGQNLLYTFNSDAIKHYISLSNMNKIAKQ